MIVSLLSDNLQKFLPILGRAISSKNQLSILQNFLLETTRDSLIIKGTDLELGVEIKLPAQVKEGGAITVPAKIFSELITMLPPEKITLEIEGTSLVLKSKKTKNTFQTIPAEEYPKLYTEKGEKKLKATVKEIKQALMPVLFAAGNDVTKPIMTGVYIQKKEHGFLFVATDGYRLSLKELSKKEGELEKTYVIPTRVLREIIGLKTEEEIEMYLSPNSNQILATDGSTTIVSRLIEGVFPAYEKIIPTSFESRVFIDTEELHHAVKICSVFAKDTGSVLRFNIEKEKITVSANTPSVGENSVEVEGKLEGEENQIAFNARYLLDLLHNIDAQEMVFEMTGPLNPGVFKIRDDSSFLHLIMPIRVQE